MSGGAVGRPTKYKPEYTEKLIEHMRVGHSFESFPARLDEPGIGRATIYKWIKKHKEFRDAKSRGELYSLYFWEDIGLDIVQGNLKNSNATAYIFIMKCRFKKYGYGDKPAAIPEIAIRYEIENANSKAIEAPI